RSDRGTHRDVRRRFGPGHLEQPGRGQEQRKTGRTQGCRARRGESCAGRLSATLNTTIAHPGWATPPSTARGERRCVIYRYCPCYCCWRRSEEHTSELQSRENLVCRLLLEKKK